MASVRYPHPTTQWIASRHLTTPVRSRESRNSSKSRILKAARGSITLRKVREAGLLMEFRSLRPTGLEEWS